MYVNNLQSVLPSCANIADCSGWAPPNLPPLGWGGRGAPEERLSLSPPLRSGESCICAFLSSCMEIIPIGGNCFPSKREEAAGVRWVRVPGGSQGQEHPLGVQGGQGPHFSSWSHHKDCWMHSTPRMRQAAPWCPHTSHDSSAPRSCPSSPTGPDPAMGSARSCQGDAWWCWGQSPALAPALSAALATGSGGCWPLAIPATSSFPEAAGPQPEPRSGSNPWL